MPTTETNPLGNWKAAPLAITKNLPDRFFAGWRYCANGIEYRLVDVREPGPGGSRLVYQGHNADALRMAMEAYIKRYPDRGPTPTTNVPSMEQVEEWISEGWAEATDGCATDPDGICEHYHPSWLVRLCLI